MSARQIMLARNRKSIEILPFEDGEPMEALAEKVRATQGRLGWIAAGVWIVPPHIRVSPRARQFALRKLHHILKRDPAGLGVLPGEWE